MICEQYIVHESFQIIEIGIDYPFEKRKKVLHSACDCSPQLQFKSVYKSVHGSPVYASTLQVRISVSELTVK